jgi:glycosidase
MKTLGERSKLRMEFHISRQAREKYKFEESIFELDGNVILANFRAARGFAHKMNAQRDLVRYPERAVKAGQINAMGLIDEISHFIVRQYRLQRNPDVFTKAMAWLNQNLGEQEVQVTLAHFADEFPPLRVYRQEMHLEDYLVGESEGIPNLHSVLEELLMLWLANVNPAFSPFEELFDDRSLENNTRYLELIETLGEFFETQPPFGPQNETLVKLLRTPALASPNSLSGQLKFIRDYWSGILGKYLHHLISGLDLIQEEEKPTFLGPGPAMVTQYTGPEMLEEERFSPDKDWMPSLVLIAKNAYVWLDQLSKEYQESITRLDQVPDQELDRLSRSGFSGLWLIGIWERSPASQRIKQMCGNPDAVASAYSLYDYTIAHRLGGDEAYDDLRARAWQRGVRLAADMVPNHVGIYSKWVIEHPDWFISLDYSPFPTYTFNGENLSEDPRVGIYLEDHYYSREDAAVVFKRVDHWTGSQKFIYHGNDGTSMPWNDTAQLNYLNPEVREAVIQTILHVARKFPVIRFDAAMTLAKKHFQRLWFPKPGTGGDIPSRSEFGLSREQFDQAMPLEFWREVVDRVAQEVPDTLLLAEAFWMMEGYFVRTLGMHRVYNSAFMNMLRDEKNDQYRQLIKNTLEFDPEILKRYVNFMNNPDEKTAIEQFGKDDKYFGICIMMATMPGLPMFGHGQVEGYHEKYGMEYYRAYWDEYPDTYLVHRHEGEIYPLLHKRYLFADVGNFFLYDFYAPEGHVEENVFAYSNRVGEPDSQYCQRALVIYHNRWADVSGWVNKSAAFKDKQRIDDTLSQTNLGAGLGLKNDDSYYTIFRDHVTGLQYIRNNRDLFDKGLFIELGAYKYHVFMDFYQVADNEWKQYRQLAQYLDGRGVPDIEEALKEVFLQPLLYPFKEVVNKGFYQWLIENRSQGDKPVQENMAAAITEAGAKMQYLFQAISQFSDSPIQIKTLTNEIRWILDAALKLPSLAATASQSRSRNLKAAVTMVLKDKAGHHALDQGDLMGWGIILSWLFTHNLGKVLSEDLYEDRSRRLIDDWLLHKIVSETLGEFDLDPGTIQESISLVKLLIKYQNWYDESAQKRDGVNRIFEALLEDWDIQRYLRFNQYRGITWFNQEAMDSLLRWLLIISILVSQARVIPYVHQAEPHITTESINERYKAIKSVQKAVDISEFQLDFLLEALK